MDSITKTSMLLNKIVIEKSIKHFSLRNNYPLETIKGERILGPRFGVTPPETGTEVLVSNIPTNLFEDTLVPLFANGGSIYKFRLMLSETGLSNLGLAYITYNTKHEAAQIIATLHNQQLLKNTEPIIVKKLDDNKRLYIGGIPTIFNKDKIWHELVRAGMANIADVIMYRSYADRARNRGFVFVEFTSHVDADAARTQHKNSMSLFGKRVYIDWSAPLRQVEEDVLVKVKKLFIRNLDLIQSRDELEAIIENVVGGRELIEKVYKNRDYAFVHFKSRRAAQKGFSLLKVYYENSSVDISWAKPPPESNDINNNSSTSHCCEHAAAVEKPDEAFSHTEPTLMDLVDFLKMNEKIPLNKPFTLMDLIRAVEDL